MKTLILVDVWQWTPFVFIIVFARLQALPQEVFEAAQVDGAGPFTTFRYVTLPLLMPAIVFAAIFRAVDAFRSFDLIYGLSYGGPARSTTTLSFFSFQNGFSFQNYGYAAAVAYMMLIILDRRHDAAPPLRASSGRGRRDEARPRPRHRLPGADRARHHRHRAVPLSARPLLQAPHRDPGAGAAHPHLQVGDDRHGPIPRCFTARACWSSRRTRSSSSGSRRSSR